MKTSSPTAVFETAGVPLVSAAPVSLYVSVEPELIVVTSDVAP